MRKVLIPMSMALLSSLMLCAAPNERNAERPGKKEPEMVRKGPRMEPPVYDKDSASEALTRPGKELSPEERAEFRAVQKRRFEIMVLINAYKIMPEAQRAPLKEELTRRIQEDLEASLASRKARIEAAEKELARLRNEIAEQEKNKEELVAKEMMRLLKMQPPRPGDRPRPPKGEVDAPPPPAPEPRED